MYRDFLRKITLVVLCFCCSDLYSDILPTNDRVGASVGVGVIRGIEGFGIQGLIGLPIENMVGRIGWQTDVFYQHETYLARVAYSYSSDFLQLFSSPDRVSNEFSLLFGLATSPDWLNFSATCGIGMIQGNARGVLLHDDGWFFRYASTNYIGLIFPIDLRASIRYHANLGWGIRYSGSLNSFYSSSCWSFFVEGVLY